MQTSVILLGDPAVGKTSLLQACCANDTTSGVKYATVQVVAKHSPCSLQLVDTDGQHDNRGDRVALLRAHQASAAESSSATSPVLIVLCFSVISPQSFENVRAHWLAELNEANSAARPRVLLCATKIDLRTDSELQARLSSRGLEPVSTAAGKQLAREIGAFRYIEVSVHLPTSVAKLLELCAEVARTPANQKPDGCDLI